MQIRRLVSQVESSVASSRTARVREGLLKTAGWLEKWSGCSEGTLPVSKAPGKVTHPAKITRCVCGGHEDVRAGQTASGQVRAHACPPCRLLMSPGPVAGHLLLASTDKAEGLLGLCTQRRTSNWTQAPTAPLCFESLGVPQGQVGDAFAAEMGQTARSFQISSVPEETFLKLYVKRHGPWGLSDVEIA